MDERKYTEEIEGLLVEITYEYEAGYSGDYWTPPTGDRVDILEWKLRDKCREDFPDYDDDEWEEWMRDIDHYVYNEAEWDIIGFEHEIREDW